MEEKKVFCKECNNNVNIIIENKKLQGKLKGQSYVYEGEIEKCTYCGSDLSDLVDTETEKNNLKALHDTYRLENRIISHEQICELPEKYDIGKRPLSNLLQWGELTFTRYFDGDLPSKTYSNTLLEIYKSPEKYLEILEANKNFISVKAYEKSKHAANNLILKRSKILDLLNYIFITCEDITPLTAQVLLYYIKGFYFAFFDKEIFPDECLANELGVHFIDKCDYNFSNIHDISVSEKAICDNVIRSFGCFSGSTLAAFTRNEFPWLTTFGVIPDIENPIILTNDLFAYFKNIKQKYEMYSLLDIKKYANNLFSSL